MGHQPSPPTIQPSPRAGAIALGPWVQKKSNLGFVPKSTRSASDIDFATVVASAYLKFTNWLQQQPYAPDSTELFVALYQAHQALSQQVRLFLDERLPIVRQDEPILAILEQFAQWRLENPERSGADIASLQEELKRVQALRS